MRGNILGAFVKPTRSSARSYGGNGAAKTGKLELGDGIRVATSTTRDNQRRGLGMEAVGCRASTYIAPELL
jgi:hypothetical protein